jgi:hypothetical protein
MQTFHLKKINVVETKEQYQVTIWKTFAAFENVDDNVDIDRAGKILKEYQASIKSDSKLLRLKEA